MSRKMLAKRGALDIQFNWIFVLIAGAIILTFFGGLIYKQKSLADDVAAGTIIKNLETEFNAAQSASASASLLDLNNFEIIVKCEDYLVGRVSEPTTFRALFSPNLVKGQKMVVWSLPWNVPFKVTNFLFVSSPDVHYFFVNSSDDWMSDLSAQLSSRFFTVSQIDSLNQVTSSGGSYKLKFVCNGCDFSTQRLLFGFPEKDASAVSFDVDSKKVSFYNKSGDSFVKTGESPFLGSGEIGLPSVFAAVFSENKDYYDCNMQKVFRTLGVVGEVYAKRSELILANLPEYQVGSCSAFYSTSADSFESIVSGANFSSSNVNSLISASADIATAQDYVRRGSCPWLY